MADHRRWRTRLRAWPRRLGRLVVLLAYWQKELVVANVVVAWEVVTPHTTIDPAIVRVPVRSRTDLELTVLANLLTITPGTLVLEIESGREYIYVHVLHLRDPEAFRRRITRLEDRLLAVTR